MAAKTISLLELRRHARKLDALIHDAWMSPDAPAQISYQDIRDLAAEISAMVAEDDGPHAATATKSPAAATDNEAKNDAQKRAALQRAAADKAPFDVSTLFIRRS